MGPFYPVMLNITGRRCVVIGGGPVALRKVHGLLEAHAQIEVISPTVVDGLRKLADEGKVIVQLREYHTHDLQGATLAFAATGNRRTNAEIARNADQLGVPVNVADVAEEGSFILPSVVRRGDLLLTVSTCGASPAYAALIKAELLERYGEEQGARVRWLGRLRAVAASRITDSRLRHEVLRAAARSQAVPEMKDENWEEQYINKYIDGLIQIVHEGGYNDGQQNDNSRNTTERTCSDADGTGD